MSKVDVYLSLHALLALSIAAAGVRRFRLGQHLVVFGNDVVWLLLGWSAVGVAVLPFV